VAVSNQCGGPAWHNFFQPLVHRTMNSMNADNAYEAENRTGINQGGQFANAPVERLTAASIIGDSVENPEGVKFGTIDNLIVNLQTSMVECAAVNFGAVPGIGGRTFAIPFSELKLMPEKKAFLLHCGQKFLVNAPAFHKTHWLEGGDQYFERVNAYWQITPEC
jgi:hypothetical protein